MVHQNLWFCYAASSQIRKNETQYKVVKVHNKDVSFEIFPGNKNLSQCLYHILTNPLHIQRTKHF